MQAASRITRTPSGHGEELLKRSESLRVAQLIESDGPGGAESVVFELSMELRDRGHAVYPVIFANGEGWLSGRLGRAGIDVYLPDIHSTLPVDVFVLRDLCRCLRDNRINILHSHEFTMSVYAGLASRYLGIPHVLTLHGGQYFASDAKRRIAMRWVAARAAAAVGVSRATCDHMIQSLGLSGSNVQMVTNGVREPHGNREIARATLGLEENERLILAVGNLYPVKGHRVLVSAAALLATMTDLPPWRIAIAGRGDEEMGLRRSISELGLEGKVQLLGLRNDVENLLAATDIWVMPSLSEGLPMALLEAMYAERPVISSGVGGIPALVEDGRSALLVPPGEATDLAAAISRLLGDRNLAASLAARGRCLVESHYSVHAMTDQYESLYRKGEARARGEPRR